MDIFQIAAVGLVAGVLAISIKKTNPEIALQVSVVAGVLILIMVLPSLSESVAFITNLSQVAGISEGVSLVLKITGIAYVCEFSSQLLKDANEGALATKVELGGKLVIVVLTLPLLGEFVELVRELAI